MDDEVSVSFNSMPQSNYNTLTEHDQENSASVGPKNTDNKADQQNIDLSLDLGASKTETKHLVYSVGTQPDDPGQHSNKNTQTKSYSKELQAASTHKALLSKNKMILAQRANKKHNFKNRLLYNSGFKTLKLINLYN